MLDQPIEMPILSSFKNELGLQWGVSYYMKPQWFGVTISSDLKQQIHNIYLSHDVLRDPDYFWPIIAQAFCMAKLGELTDPSLVNIQTAQRYRAQERQVIVIEEKRFNLLLLALTITRTWANDIRHQYWQNLTSEDHDKGCYLIAEQIRRGGWENLLINARIVRSAECLSLEKRYGSLPVRLRLDNVLQEFPPKFQTLVETLGTFLSALPRLSYKKEWDLQTFEIVVQQASKRLQLEISPYLEEEGGQKVWAIE